MNFLWPLALLGLLTLPVILFLHLLRNRRQQFPISNLELWRGLQQRKQGVRPRNIPLSLMLLLQLLIATALTLAVARPVLSFLLDQPQQTIFILDMTTSMTAEDTPQLQNSPVGSRRFDAARQMIQTQLQALNNQDTFALISLSPQPEILLTGDGQLKTQALLALDNLVPGATGSDLVTALTLANGLVNPNQRSQIMIFTDGAYNVAADSLPDLLAPVTWRLIPNFPSPQAGNQALLNVSARTLPDDRHRLFARVVNYSEAPVARTVRVSVGERLFDELTLQLEPGAETAQVWTLPKSAETARVDLVEPDIMPLDNSAELWLVQTTRLQVLLVSETPEILSRALAAQPDVELTLSAPQTLPDPTDFDLIVFEGSALPAELTSWPRSNLLVVNPPLGHPLLPAQNLTHNLLRPDLTTASELLAGIDLSGVYFDRVTQFTTLPQWAEVDLAAAGAGEGPSPAGQPLVFHGSTGNSRIVVWTFDLAASNLPARLALPLLTANTLSNLLSPAPRPVTPIGESILLNGNYSVEIPGGQRLFPPLQNEGWTGNLFSRTKQPGLYRIYNERDALVAGFAVHAGSALESNPVPQFQPEQLNMQRSTFSPLPPEIDYYDFWPWLAGMVLGVIMIEGWLAWRR